MSMENLSQQTLGQYELRELLGVGGMGAVYRAYQASLKREVAVKVLPSTLAAQAGYAERFIREAETAAALEHPHIVPIVDYGTVRGTSYIVMRLLTGGTLAGRLAARPDQPPSLGEIAEILKDLASALDYAHKLGVIHRDLKPTNVMFDNQGNAYLVDFGIAKLLGAMGPTKSSMTIGTPSYMAPEQWRNAELTPAADQYALGVMIYQLVTGRVPFEADTPYGLMHMHLHEMPTPPQSIRAGVPEAVTNVLHRAMAKEASQRFPTMTALAQAFEGAIAGNAGEPTKFMTFRLPARPSVGVLTPGQSSSALRATGSLSTVDLVKRNPLILGIVGLIALLVVVAVLLMSQGSAGTPTPVAAVATETATIAAQVPAVVTIATETETPTPDVVAMAQTVMAQDTAQAYLTARAVGEILTSTPPASETPASTATASITSSHTPTPSETPLPIIPVLDTDTPSPTASETATATATTTETTSPTSTWTATSSATWTSAPTSTATWTATLTATPTAIEVPSVTHTATITPSPAAAPSATPTALPTNLPEALPTLEVVDEGTRIIRSVEIIGSTRANLRSGPSTSSNLVTRVAPGERYVVNEVQSGPDQGSTWYQVQLWDGSSAWVRGDLVRIEERTERIVRVNWTPVERDFNDVTMVLVPAGCFDMGSNDGDPDERPVHEQCFDEPFWMDKFEVTQAQFRRLGGTQAISPRFVGDERPVETITWFEAGDFCALRGGRLPTEAEWEYAARGPENRFYPWGDTWNANNAVWNRSESQGTVNVGSILAGASWVGALDMSGNVWEWTSSLPEPYPYDAEDGRERDTESSTDVWRVLRGGSWLGGGIGGLDASARYLDLPGFMFHFAGFRCARSYDGSSVSAPIDLTEQSSSITPVNDPSAGPESVETVESVVYNFVTVVSSQGANLRSGPGTNYPSVGGARQNETMEVIGQANQNGLWYLVIHQGRERWVSAAVVRFTGDPDTVTTITNIPPPPQPTAVPVPPTSPPSVPDPNVQPPVQQQQPQQPPPPPPPPSGSAENPTAPIVIMNPPNMK